MKEENKDAIYSLKNVTKTYKNFSGITHALNSYGIFNYQKYKYDYIRCGILMYGINNNNSYLSKNIDLKPIFFT